MVVSHAPLVPRKATPTPTPNTKNKGFFTSSGNLVIQQKSPDFRIKFTQRRHNHCKRNHHQRDAE